MFVFELGLYNDQLDKELGYKPKHTSRWTAETAGKAKYDYYLYCQDGIFETDFKTFLNWVYCKKVGVASINHLFGDAKQFDHMKEIRDLPFIYQGMKVEVCGRPGVIVGGNSSANLDVVFDGEWKKNNCHPYEETAYFDSLNKIVVDFRKKKVQA